MDELLACIACKQKFGNNGLPKVYHMTESDTGTYYKAHVRCEQCGRCVNGDKTDASAVKAWNKIMLRAVARGLA